MKTNQIISCIIISIVLASCFNKNYRMITRVERNGSCRGEIYEIMDSIVSQNFTGWEISQTDTVVKDYLSPKNKNNVKISKKFQSVEELSADTIRQRYSLSPKESLKKRFRWFYTCYAFTAVYPEVTNKGCVPIEKYLNKDEQKFYFQGDMSAYRGMNGWELQEKLDDIGNSFMEWYSRTLYEESFDVIMRYTDTEFHTELPAIKDSLYYINTKNKTEYDISSFPDMDEICTWLDKFFVTGCFSEQYAGFGGKMDKILDEKFKETNELLNYSIQYELALPGKLMSTNADLQNDGNLVWKINMLRFLTDDYMLTAESRAVNVWAFAVTLLLIVFSVACFIKLR